MVDGVGLLAASGEELWGESPESNGPVYRLSVQAACLGNPGDNEEKGGEMSVRNRVRQGILRTSFARHRQGGAPWLE